MFSGPMFRHEYLAATRSLRPFLFRTFVGGLLGVATLIIALVAVYAAPPRPITPQERVVGFGLAVFFTTITLEVLILIFSIPTFVGGAIAEERQKDTLSLLLLTRLTPLEIVLTKAVARWLSVVNLVLVGLPIILVAGWLGGLTSESALAVLTLISTAGFLAALAVLASAQREQVGTARAQSMAWNFGWLIVPPVIAAAPIRATDLWGELLLLLKSVCLIVGPSSPISLLCDRGWYHQSGLFGLEGRIAAMIGLQAVLGLVALWFAAGKLKPRETNPNWLDPTRGYRPPCGDDPIYWREFDLPMRRGSGSPLGLAFRTLWILIRAILINLMLLLGVLLRVAVPIGILLATGHYGLAAGWERWEHGSGGPFEERWKFTLVIRAAVGMLAFLPALNLISTVSARITLEKHKKSWEALLLTPLDGREILRSKARAAVQGLRRAVLPLFLLGALGLICGVVTPLGVAITAVDLVLAVWAAIALGLYLGIKAEEPAVAASRATWITLGFFLLHLPLLYGALASTPEFFGWDARVRWGLVVACLVVPTLTGVVAWRLSRLVADRFDEWVGRPIARAAGSRGTGPVNLVPAPQL